MAGYVLLLACTSAKPEFEDLASSLSGPTFSGVSNRPEFITANYASLTISGECDLRIDSLEWSNDGIFWNPLSSIPVNPGSDLLCSDDGLFVLPILDISNVLGTFSPAEMKYLYFRGMTVIGPTASSVVSVTYTAPANIAPTISGSCPTTVTAGSAYVCLGLGATDPDPATTITWGWGPGTTCSGYTLFTGTGVINASPTISGTCVIEIIASDGIANSNSYLSTVTVDPGPPNSIAFATQPASTYAAGDPITATVNILDVYGNIITSDSSTSISMNLVHVPAATLNGTVAKTVNGGTATFNDLSVYTVGTLYQLQAGAGALLAYSNTFDITPGAPSSLGFTTQPASGTAAGNDLLPAVAVYDLYGNLATNDNSTTVTLTLAANPNGGTLSGSTSITVANGIATWSASENLALDFAGAGYQFQADATGLSTALSNSFSIVHGNAVYAVFGVSPANALAGGDLLPVVNIIDSFGNIVTSDNTTSITLSIALPNPTGGTLFTSSSLTRTVTSGSATFYAADHLYIDKVGTYSLDVSNNAGLSNAISNTFSIFHGNPSQLVWSGVPTYQQVSTNFSPTVTIQDAFGNTATSAAANVVLSINVGSPNLNGTLTLAPTAGVANFSGLNFDSIGSKSIMASYNALNASSNAITVYSPLTLNANSITMTAKSGQTFTFSASGGVPPYVYSGSGAGSINTSTGVFTAGTSVSPGVVTVTDNVGNTAICNVKHLEIETNGAIYSIIKDGSGSKYVGGIFSSVRPYAANRMIMLDLSTGEPHLPFDTGGAILGNSEQIVTSVALPDGSIIMAGSFNSYKGTNVKNIMKLKPDGTLDATFAAGVGTGPNLSVASLTLDGTDLYVGGQFTSWNGMPSMNYLVRINVDTGIRDTGFTSPLNAAVTGVVVANSRLYVIGNFSTPTFRIAALNFSGVVDPTFSIGSSFNGSTTAIASDGSSLYVGGWFSNYNGTSSSRIAQLNFDGTINAGFIVGTGFSANVNSIYYDGTFLFVGGAFTSYNGTTVKGLAKLIPSTGALVTPFSQSNGVTGGTSEVRSVIAYAGNVYAGGYFTAYRAVPANNLIKVDSTTGALDATFTGALGTNNPVMNVNIAINGGSSRLFVGGAFDTYRGVAANNIAKFSPTDTISTGFLSGGGFDSAVYALATDGIDIYVGGQFTSYGGSPTPYFAKLNSSGVKLMGAAGDFNGPVRALLINGGDVYAGGDFSVFKSISSQRLVKFDASTGVRNSTFTLTTGITGTGTPSVKALATDGINLYVGTNVLAGSAYRGTSYQGLFKVDLTNGILDTTFTSPTGFNSNVYAIAISGDGMSVYAGGTFSDYQGVANAAKGLAKLDATNGLLDTTFTAFNNGISGSVSALAIASNNLYVGGGIFSYRGTPATQMVKIDATSGIIDNGFSQFSGLSGNNLQALTILGSELHAGGGFTAYRGSTPALYSIRVDPINGSPLP